MAKKYYVVWNGVHTGIFDSWEECQLQIKGYPDAKFKSFGSREEAIMAYRGNPEEHLAIIKQIAKHRNDHVNYDAFPEIIQDAIAVDASCPSNPGPVEYRGVHVRTGREIFRVGPLPGGTNNIGEFMALIHALALLDKKGRYDIPIYTDSRTALSWLRNKRTKTTMTRTAENAKTMEIFDRAIRWMETHTARNPILKWETDRWGEIPADYGRK